MVLQEAEKHSCGEAYEIIKPMVDDSKKEIDDFGWLRYCGKCEVYNFNGEDFRSEEEADKYLEKNKDLIKRSFEFLVKPNVCLGNAVSATDNQSRANKLGDVLFTGFRSYEGD